MSLIYYKILKTGQALKISQNR